MTFEPRLEHGGSVAEARARWGEPAEGWLDLSTGLNPHAYPVGPVSSSFWQRLPDGDGLEALIEAARNYYAAPYSAAIAAAAGSQSLINLLPFLFSPRRVAVLNFTYGEHAHRWRLAGHEVRIVEDLNQTLNAEIAIVTNPNNPDGRRIPAQTIGEFAAAFADKEGLLVVDEAFCDVATDLSVARQTGSSGLLVLRSFGKFFGLAGVRLGFALGEKNLIDRLRSFLGSWPVSGPALSIGTVALSDTGWIAETRGHLRTEASRLEHLLITAGFELVGGTDLFKLGRHIHAGALFDRLGHRGILVRRFAEHSDWLRFGLPPDSRGYERLAAAITA